MTHPIIRRTSDGALFYGYRRSNGSYCFTRVEWKRAGWIPWKRWVRTGEVWTPEDDRDWEVVQ